MTICLHHNDLDGRCAAAIVAASNLQEEIDFIEVDYRSQVPQNIPLDEEIVIVDFTWPQAEQWQELWEQTRNIVWIDHHEPVITKMYDLAWPTLWTHGDPNPTHMKDLAGLRRYDACGAMLTWEYYYPEDSCPELLHRFGYDLDWEGWRIKVLHTERRGSQIFDSVKSDYDIVMPVNFDGKKYTVHLYSDTVKVNDIAVKHGGGGHPGAAGFVCDKLPWT